MNRFAVFTKPWKGCSLDELGEMVAGLGFDAVEYPLRDGFQVEPAEGAAGLKRLCATLGKHGVRVASVAAGIDVAKADGKGEVVGVNEGLFAACGESGVPIIRICQSLDSAKGIFDNLDALRAKYDEVARLAEKHGVTLGVQMHYGYADIIGSYDTYLLIKDYDPKHIAAVWDAGHSGLAGENPRLALELLYDRLCLVNFKAAYWYRANGPEADAARFTAYWTTGRNGMCPWGEAVAYLKERAYAGAVCLPAEYTDEPNVARYAKEDLAYIKGLFANG